MNKYQRNKELREMIKSLEDQKKHASGAEYDQLHEQINQLCKEVSF